jgi:hypothetical protein
VTRVVGDNIAVFRAPLHSEQIYALKHFFKRVTFQIIMKAINYALKVNFPNKGLKLGFYHQAAEKSKISHPRTEVINQ